MLGRGFHYNKRMIGNVISRSLLAVFLVIAAAESMAKEALFSEDTVLRIKLTGPLAATQKSKRRVENAFSMQMGDQTHPVQVRVRGNSRLRVCKFPPLRVRFSDGVDTGPFTGQQKLKLVTHCTPSATGDSYVLKEYVAYKILEQLSSAAYQVRLAKIDYVDSAKPDSPILERNAFFLESNEALATRLGPEQELTGIRLSQLNATQASLVYIYQYMIGNTDWGFAPAIGDKYCCHNVRLFEGSDKLLPVPYDFDLSGLVSTRYAKPDPRFTINTVRQRLYRGYCIDRSALTGALATIKSKRPAILASVTDTPGLSGKDVKRMEDYLGAFFDLANDSEALLDSFEKRCL